MKSRLKKILQRVLGMETYLYVFAVFVIRTLRYNRREGDFCRFLRLIEGSGILLDIGAMSYHMAKRFPESRVYAFEPVPVNLLTLRRIVKRFGLDNVSVCDYALGDKEGRAEIVMPELKSVKMQGLSHIVHETIDELNEGERFDIQVKRLDDLEFLRGEDKKIAAIKLDVENFEYFVLKGGENLIKKHRPLIYSELWDNENRQRCFELMNSIGYSIKVLKNKELEDFNPALHKTQNFFFIP